MEKSVILFWRYFGSALALFEIAAYFLLLQYPDHWQFVRIQFLIINTIIIIYLVQAKLKVEKHNAQVDAVCQEAKS